MNFFLILLVFVLVNIKMLAQDSINKKNDSTHINGFINIVPGNYNGPLFGFVNLAHGDQKGTQIALFNWNQHNFTGNHLQLATMNIIGGTIDSATQVGFINFWADTLKGEQVGLVNFVKVRKGFQLGFINYADTVSSGLSIAVMTIVRKGYYGLETSVSEMYPINVSFKTGLKNMYTSANFSCDNNGGATVFGFGFGSIIPVYKRFFLNPEFAGQSGILKCKQDVFGLVTKLSFAVTKHIYVSAGPSIVWSHANTAELRQPIYALSKNQINDRNSIIIGLRCSLSYNMCFY